MRTRWKEQSQSKTRLSMWLSQHVGMSRYDQVMAVNGHAVSSMDDLPEVRSVFELILSLGDAHG